MNFTKRTTFSDDVDKEIYIFKMMVNLAENIRSITFERDIVLYGVGIIHIEYDYSDDVNVMYFRALNKSFVSNKNNNLIEVGSKRGIDIVNIRVPTHYGINRNKNSLYFDEYSLTNGSEEMDDELDKLLIGGVMNIPEELYFQQSLLRDEVLSPYEDLPRYMEALNIETTLDGVCFFHSTEYNLSITEFNKIYDLVLKSIEDHKC